MITSPLHPPVTSPVHPPYIPLTSPLHPLYTHTPHTPQGVAPPTAGAFPLKGKISVTPPTNPKTLTDVNASRVPSVGMRLEEPRPLLSHFSTRNLARIGS